MFRPDTAPSTIQRALRNSPSHRAQATTSLFNGKQRSSKLRQRRSNYSDREIGARVTQEPTLPPFDTANITGVKQTTLFNLTDSAIDSKEVAALTDGLKFIPHFRVDARMITQLEATSLFQVLRRLEIPILLDTIVKNLNRQNELKRSQQHRTLRAIDTDSIATIVANDIYRVTPTDKNLGIALWCNKAYTDECKHQLTQHQYNQVRNPSAAFQAQNAFALRTGRTIQTLIPRYGQELLDFVEAFTIDERTVPKFYLLPKVHKTVIAGRPIVASFNWINTYASRMLSIRLQLIVAQLQQYRQDGLLPFMPIVSSSFEAKQLLLAWCESNQQHWREHRLPKLVCTSWDFTSLYTNLQHSTIRNNITYIMTMMNGLDPHRWTEDEMLCIETLTAIVINSTYFHCPELQATYHQVVGLPMGTNCAPELANLVLLAEELKNLAGTDRSAFFMMRYIDDIFVVSTKELTTKVRTAYTTTGLAITSGDPTVFLDLKITIHKHYEDYANPLWSFNFDVHQKDLNKYQYTMFGAQAPLATKKGLITGELVRYARLTTTFEQFHKIRELFIARLMQRGYKRKFIDRVVRQCNYFLLQEHYCKPIDFQARIAKYRAKLLIDYREPVPPVWKVLYTFNGTNHRRFIQSMAQHFGFTLPSDFKICNVRLPNTQEVVTSCQRLFHKWQQEQTTPPSTALKLQAARHIVDLIIGNNRKRWNKSAFIAQRLIQSINKRGEGATKVRRELQLRLLSHTRGRVVLTESAQRPRQTVATVPNKRKWQHVHESNVGQSAKRLKPSPRAMGVNLRSSGKRMRTDESKFTDSLQQRRKTTKRRDFTSMDYKWY